jgi:hypothetical protein
MNIEEVRTAISAAGGRENALAYAEALLEKLNRLEATGSYRALFRQLLASHEPGDFRGRVLEVNFADLFVRSGEELTYGARQAGTTGDVDFRWNVVDHEIFIEMKLLGQDRAGRDDMAAQLASKGFGRAVITDDTRDVGRIQLDLIQKSSARKFNPKPSENSINLVALDVAELQLGTVDLCDCLLAAGGNPIASRHCDPLTLRPNVVGLFEAADLQQLGEPQRTWVNNVHRVAPGEAHPREYIHGALFLFREPTETAALSYDLSQVLVWNPSLMDETRARPIVAALQRVLPSNQSFQNPSNRRGESSV